MHYIELHIIFAFFSISALLSILCFVIFLLSKDTAQKKRTLTVSIILSGLALFIYHNGHNGGINTIPDAIFHHFDSNDTKIIILNDRDDIYFVESNEKTYIIKPFFGFIRAKESSYTLPDAGYIQISRNNQ